MVEPEPVHLWIMMPIYAVCVFGGAIGENDLNLEIVFKLSI